MRISLEGVDTEQGRNFSGNRLKALKKMNSRFFKKAVDKAAKRCRIRSLD